MKKRIGRGKDNDLIIPSDFAKVSTHHCIVELQSDGNYYLTDIGSRNGTTINDILIPQNKPQRIGPTDEIILGNQYTLTWDQVLSLFKGKTRRRSSAPSAISAPGPSVSVSLQDTNDYFYKYSGFWVRFGAKFIDNLIILSGVLLVGYFFSLIISTQPNHLIELKLGLLLGVIIFFLFSLLFDFGSIAIINIMVLIYISLHNIPNIIEPLLGFSFFINFFAALVSWLYFSFQWSSKYQATLGMRLFQIFLVDEKLNSVTFGRANGRFFAQILSSLILIGHIMCGFHPEKRTFHDIISKTRVIRYERPQSFLQKEYFEGIQ